VEIVARGSAQSALPKKVAKTAAQQITARLYFRLPIIFVALSLLWFMRGIFSLNLLFAYKAISAT
jgi:hypothetical protein